MVGGIITNANNITANLLELEFGDLHAISSVSIAFVVKF